MEDLKRYFGDVARYHKERLVSGRPVGNGAHPMVDACHALSLECLQRALKDCLEPSCLFSIGQPEQGVKKENGQPVKHRTSGLKR